MRAQSDNKSSMNDCWDGALRPVPASPLVRRSPRTGVTLSDLLAVMLVIVLLTAITIGITGYVQRKMAISTAKTTIAAMEIALEAYKSDWGYYPPTSAIRISVNLVAEGSNNLVLYRALFGANGGRKYLSLPPSMLRSNTLIPRANAGAPVAVGIFDPWGTPYNYYNSPSTLYANIDTNWYKGYTTGGQVNISTYDLWSYQ